MNLSENPQPNGILLLNKKLGITSHSAVASVRKILKMQKIGHAGTLDPLATGLLILMIGKATKVSQYLVTDDKSYEGTLCLGSQTPSYDGETEVSEIRDTSHLSEADIIKAFHDYSGEFTQIPPMFSAIKINGRRLYKSARKGNDVERPGRLIHIYKNEILEIAMPYVKFKIHCSKGTYIRSLAHDIGQNLGCGAYLSQLHRTQSGPFDIEKSLTIDQLETIPLTQINSHLIDHNQFLPSNSNFRNL